MNSAIDLPFSATHRLPAWALGLSLAVHLAVLAGPLLPRQAPVADLPPLVVNFRLPAVLAPAATDNAPPARIVPPPSVAVRATATERKPAPVARPALLAVAGPASAASALSVPAVPAPTTPLAVAPVAERSEIAPTARIAEASAPAEPIDPAAMARYIRLLGDLLAQQQQYPRLAAARGWEGEVRLRVQVARKGAIIAVHVVHSSGFDVLDQHAVHLVESATLPPPPAAPSPNSSLNGASPDLLIDIPIHYTLKRS